MQPETLRQSTQRNSWFHRHWKPILIVLSGILVLMVIAVTAWFHNSGAAELALATAISKQKFIERLGRPVRTGLFIGGSIQESGIGAGQLAVSDRDLIEYDRRLAEHHKLVLPAKGIVPDEETAKAIALAVAIPIWGKDQVESELPLRAGLKGNVWTVIGSLPGTTAGGELAVQLDKRTGAVVSIFHTM